MCYHKYTHYGACKRHIHLHTHLCPKNVNDDQTRVLFCEDYTTVRVQLQDRCPHCSPRRSTASPASLTLSTGSRSGLGGLGLGYPTPPKTNTP
ncbi:hypothetical protein LTR53_015262 [Teratosphaeriaceae sp. CCFEE 6253]|nr:hypothetical protein LTR53_015262 [Teratosphaeriaceae sp. CCFEE 6253]